MRQRHESGVRRRAFARQSNHNTAELPVSLPSLRSSMSSRRQALSSYAAALAVIACPRIARTARSKAALCRTLCDMAWARRHLPSSQSASVPRVALSGNHRPGRDSRSPGVALSGANEAGQGARARTHRPPACDERLRSGAFRCGFHHLRRADEVPCREEPKAGGGELDAQV